LFKKLLNPPLDFQVKYSDTRHVEVGNKMQGLQLSRGEKNRPTMAVVAAPKMAMRDRTEIWPMNVAMASNTNTPYT
jgi:hypothetical protein